MSSQLLPWFLPLSPRFTLLPFFFFLFLYQHHRSVQRREIWSKKPQRLEESIRQCPAQGGNTDVGKIRINDAWILDPCRQGPARGGSAECTNPHAVRATPPVFKKSAIHHLTPSITVMRHLKSTWDCERQLHDTGELHGRSGRERSNSPVRNPLCSPSGLDERVLSPVTPVY